MIIKRAEHSGFCFGVQRAITMAEKASQQGPVHSMGPLIHNEDEVKRLQELGITSIGMEDEKNSSTLIIRSHGEKKENIESLKEEGYELKDATCPFVKKIHRYMETYSNLGYEILLIGDKNHPEIVAASSYGATKVWIANNYEEVKNFTFHSNLLVLSQTTLQENVFKEVQDNLRLEKGDLVFMNTICHATKNRQESVKKLAGEVDAMVIIGGLKSSNTRKLFEIAASINKNTFFFENSDDLQVIKLKNYDIIGIGAGASTPEWIITQVIEKLLKEKE